MQGNDTGRCRHGHLLTPENTYVRPDGHRKCRKCMAAADRRYRERKNELLAKARQLEAVDG